MLRRRQNSKAQSISEYVVLIGIVTAALLGMQVYMKRGIQGVIKVQADQLGPQQGQQVFINFKRQTKSDSTTYTSSAGTVATESFVGGGRRKDYKDTKTYTSGTSTSTVKEVD